jgi:hypothetical protein
VKEQVAALELAFAPAPQPAQPDSTSPKNPVPPSEANAYVSFALAAVRTNDSVGAVMALQRVRQLPGPTAAQLMAVQRALDAVTADLVARAGRGDPKALADLEAVEKTRSQ